MFIITKSLRAFYANEDSIPHKVLANRIGERDPGNKPKANDRIPYVFQKIDEYIHIGYGKKKEKRVIGKLKNGKPKTKLFEVVDYEKPKFKKINIKPGDRIESPEFIIKNNVKIDYSHYISNQIMNPVKQVLELSELFMNSPDRNIFESFIDSKMQKCILNEKKYTN